MAGRPKRRARLSEWEQAEADKKQAKEQAQRAVYTSLWEDPKYLRLHAYKDMLWKRYYEADAYKRPEAARLLKLFDRSVKRINAYEDAKLAKAGASYPGREHFGGKYR